MWEYNRAEKATQMGARFAAATDMVAGRFADYSFVDSPTALLAQGSCSDLRTFDSARLRQLRVHTASAATYCGVHRAMTSAAFYANIVDRMAAMYPAIER